MCISINPGNSKQFTYVVHCKLYPYLGKTCFNSQARTDNSDWASQDFTLSCKNFPQQGPSLTYTIDVSIIPLPLSYCTFIPARKNSTHISKMLLFQLFTFDKCIRLKFHIPKLCNSGSFSKMRPWLKLIMSCTLL
jgi:hypothetical protein